MVDFLRFTQGIMEARNRLKGLRGSGINIFHVNNDNRVLAFHRWVPGEGHDVVVVVSLNEWTHFNYDLGFPINGIGRRKLTVTFTITGSILGWPATAGE